MVTFRCDRKKGYHKFELKFGLTAKHFAQNLFTFLVNITREVLLFYLHNESIQLIECNRPNIQFMEYNTNDIHIMIHQNYCVR